MYSVCHPSYWSDLINFTWEKYLDLWGSACWMWDHEQNLKFQNRLKLKTFQTGLAWTLNPQCELSHSQDRLLLLCFTRYCRHDQIKEKGHRTLFFTSEMYSWPLVIRCMKSLSCFYGGEPRQLRAFQSFWVGKKIGMPQMFRELGNTTDPL